jgi:hypothetical protein
MSNAELDSGLDVATGAAAAAASAVATSATGERAGARRDREDVDPTDEYRAVAAASGKFGRRRAVKNKLAEHPKFVCATKAYIHTQHVLELEDEPENLDPVTGKQLSKGHCFSRCKTCTLTWDEIKRRAYEEGDEAIGGIYYCSSAADRPKSNFFQRKN